MTFHYTVKYKDGRVFRKPLDDKSLVKEGKSAFYDVELKNVKAFCVETEKGWSAEVELERGTITLNDQVIADPFDNGSPRSLIYFIRNKMDITGYFPNSVRQWCCLGWEQGDQRFALLLEL